MIVICMLLSGVCAIVAVLFAMIAILSFVDPEMGAGFGIFFTLVAVLFGFLAYKLISKGKMSSTPSPIPATKGSDANPQPVAIPKVASALEQKPQPAPSAWSSYKFRVAGVYYREKDIYEIMDENDDYHLGKKAIIEADMVGDTIYKYEIASLDAELIPEPDNEYDPNAIKVVVMGVMIGYVPKEKTKKVKTLLESGTVVFIACDIYGGPYKVLEDEEESIERGETALKADVEIRFKK